MGCGALVSGAKYAVPTTLSEDVLRDQDVDAQIEELLKADQSGEQALAKLDRDELRRVMKNTIVIDRLSVMRLSTRVFVILTNQLVKGHTGAKTKDIVLTKDQTKWDDGNSVVNCQGILVKHFDLDSRLAFFGLDKAQEAVVLVQNALPIDDTKDPSLEFGSVAEGVVFGQRLLGHLLPKPRYVWPELASDQSQADVAYYGFAQLFLVRSDDESRGEHMIDLRAMSTLSVRKGFEKVGGAAYFSEKKLNGIFWSHGDRYIVPGDKSWEHVKFAWRVTQFLWLTGVEHLGRTHFIMSNGINSSIEENFPSKHPVRRVLEVSRYGAEEINSTGLVTLAEEGCFFHRMSGLEFNDGLAAALKIAADSHIFETWPEHVEKSTLPPDVKQDLPIFVDGLDVWAALHRFYSAYVDHYYKDDDMVTGDSCIVEYWKFRCCPAYTQGLPPLSKAALINQLTYACFSVTAYHQLVGDVVGYLTTPDGYFFHVKENQIMTDAESMLNAMCLMASTGRTMPMFMSDWSALLEPECKVLHEQLLTDLQDVSSRIASRNQARKISFTEFDPKYFEASVSV